MTNSDYNLRKITGVLVIYQSLLSESSSLATLKKYLKQHPERKDLLELVVYDNSPEAQKVNEDDEIHFHYIHDDRNLGIAEAYNYAWRRAEKNASTFIWLMDQDSDFTDAYLDTIFTTEVLDEPYVALAPRVFSQGYQVSPVPYYNQYNHQVKVQSDYQEAVRIINSGMLFSVSFISKLEGFNANFPLDFLDNWLSYEVKERNKKIKIMPLEIQHELSVLNPNSVGIKRYTSILDAERYYYTQFERSELWKYRLHLVLRAFKQGIRYHNFKKFRMNFSTFGKSFQKDVVK